jgi:hypothetical protein
MSAVSSTRDIDATLTSGGGPSQPTRSSAGPSPMPRNSSSVRGLVLARGVSSRAARFSTTWQEFLARHAKPPPAVVSEARATRGCRGRRGPRSSTASNSASTIGLPAGPPPAPTRRLMTPCAPAAGDRDANRLTLLNRCGIALLERGRKGRTSICCQQSGQRFRRSGTSHREQIIDVRQLAYVNPALPSPSINSTFPQVRRCVERVTGIEPALAAWEDNHCQRCADLRFQPEPDERRRDKLTSRVDRSPTARRAPPGRVRRDEVPTPRVAVVTLEDSRCQRYADLKFQHEPDERRRDELASRVAVGAER